MYVAHKGKEKEVIFSKQQSCLKGQTKKASIQRHCDSDHKKVCLSTIQHCVLLMEL